MDDATTRPWSCKRCGRQLAVIEGEPPRPMFDAAMLPSLIRNHMAFIVVECPYCGWEQRWNKRAAEGVDSSAAL